MALYTLKGTSTPLQCKRLLSAAEDEHGSFPRRSEGKKKDDYLPEDWSEEEDTHDADDVYQDEFEGLLESEGEGNKEKDELRPEGSVSSIGSQLASIDEQFRELKRKQKALKELQKKVEAHGLSHIKPAKQNVAANAASTADIRPPPRVIAPPPVAVIRPPPHPQDGINRQDAMTFTSIMNELADKDPDCLFVLKGFNKLGFQAGTILKQHFSKYGKVVKVWFAHRADGSSKRRASNIAFIQMATGWDVQDVLAMGDEQEVDGIAVRVIPFEPNKSDEDSCYDEAPGKGTHSQTYNDEVQVGEEQHVPISSILHELADQDPDCIFVIKGFKKLGYQAGTILRKYFSRHGQLVKVLFALRAGRGGRDKKSGTPQLPHPCNLGFVQMARASDAQNILAMGDTHVLNSYPIQVQRYERLDPDRDWCHDETGDNSTHEKGKSDEDLFHDKAPGKSTHSQSHNYEAHGGEQKERHLSSILDELNGYDPACILSVKGFKRLGYQAVGFEGTYNSQYQESCIGQYFSKHGQVLKVLLVTPFLSRSGKQRPSNLAFVQMATVSDAQNVLAMGDTHVLNSYPIQVHRYEKGKPDGGWCDDEAGDNSTQEKGTPGTWIGEEHYVALSSALHELAGQDPDCICVVKGFKGLGYQAGSILRQYFSRHGQLVKVLFALRAGRDSVRQMACNLGFVQMARASDAQNILAMGDTHVLNSYPIQVHRYERVEPDGGWCHDEAGGKSTHGKGKSEKAPGNWNHSQSYNDEAHGREQTVLMMSKIVQELDGQDPASIFAVKGFKRLGYQAETIFRQYFSNYGQVLKVFLVQPFEKRRPANLGFVQMATARAAQNVLAMGDTHMVNTIPVRVQSYEKHEPGEDWCHGDPLDNSTQEKGEPDEDPVKESSIRKGIQHSDRMLFVKGFSKLGSQAEEILRLFFSKRGQVLKVHTGQRWKSSHSRDRRKHRTGNFGFVEMATASDAQKVLEMGNVQVVNGVHVLVRRYEKEKPDDGLCDDEALDDCAHSQAYDDDSDEQFDEQQYESEEDSFNERPLEALAGQDPACLLFVKGFSKLGFQSGRILREHFSTHGHVLRVMLKHSVTRAGGWRPSNFGFVQMATPRDTEKVLAIGDEQVVGGIAVQVQRFKQQKSDEDLCYDDAPDNWDHGQSHDDGYDEQRYEDQCESDKDLCNERAPGKLAHSQSDKQHYNWQERPPNLRETLAEQDPACLVFVKGFQRLGAQAGNILSKYFSRYGQVLTVHTSDWFGGKGKRGKKCNFGFIQMATARDAEKVFAMGDEQVVNCIPIRVQRFEQKRSDEDPCYGEAPDDLAHSHDESPDNWTHSQAYNDAHGRDQATAENFERHGTLASILDELAHENPACVLVVKGFSELGPEAGKVLRKHFSAHGHVLKVLFQETHSFRSPKGGTRQRPSNFGFVQMATPWGAHKVLAMGDAQEVDGITIRVHRFQQQQTQSQSHTAGYDKSRFKKQYEAAVNQLNERLANRKRTYVNDDERLHSAYEVGSKPTVPTAKKPRPRPSSRFDEPDMDIED